MNSEGRVGGVPGVRVRTLRDFPARPQGSHVLYWMTAARRLGWNFALQRAAGWARELGRPLVILEALRVGYPWASDRLHRFLLDGMAEHRGVLRGGAVLYHPYVEPQPGAGRGLLEAMAADACVVVADDFPSFFLPRMLAAAAQRLRVRFEAVDTNGLLPLRAADRAFTSAYHFRRFLQRELPGHLPAFPEPDPLAAELPSVPRRLLTEVRDRWPTASAAVLAAKPNALHALPIDHSVTPVEARGGAAPASRVLQRFLADRLARYAEARQEPEARATSGLSPWLHFGHISTHGIFASLAEREEWTEGDLADEARGKREGWWGMSAGAEAFLEELVTWRELGFNGASFIENYDGYESLPEWARRTLEAHADDPREYVYTRDEFEDARTHDPLWNAAQTQLRREGHIHNSLRMLWGKKILEWTATPRDALEVMIDLNNRWAVDGRDPNSYSGIFWCLGRYDRAWGPERPVYGKVRYMSSAAAARKYDLGPYLERYAA